MSSAAKNNDLLYLRYPLIHEGRNLNGHIWDPSEMHKCWSSLIDTPLDKDHTETIDAVIGKHYAAELLQENGEWIIYAEGYVYADLYPDVVRKLEDGSITGVSMECAYSYGEKTMEGTILRGITFLGAGLVRRPADPKALVSLSSVEPDLDRLARRIAASILGGAK